MFPPGTVHRGMTIQPAPSTDAARAIVAIWQGLCPAPGRRPARPALRPSLIKRYLSMVALVEVLDGGDDFYFAIMGQMLTHMMVGTHQREKMSDRPEHPSTLRWLPIYGAMVKAGATEPLYATGKLVPGAGFDLDIEVVLMPLGPDDRVTHLLAFVEPLDPTVKLAALIGPSVSRL